MIFPLHQFLLFWKGDELGVVWTDQQPFIATSDSIFGLIKFKGKKKNETLRETYMESRDIGGIQDQAAKLLKTTTIVPFRLIKDHRRYR